jgi:hypothetical protein
MPNEFPNENLRHFFVTKILVENMHNVKCSLNRRSSGVALNICRTADRRRETSGKTERLSIFAEDIGDANPMRISKQAFTGDYERPALIVAED